jgi:hypothetical protein
VVGTGALVAGVVLLLVALVAGVVGLVAVLLLDPQPASASRLAAASKAVALW